ncbi:potassium/sodium hyperpolarization-activated cyclic nucleotide-gated channel 4-like, partial [Tropilaelaps mercedesae]
ILEWSLDKKMEKLDRFEQGASQSADSGQQSGGGCSTDGGSTKTSGRVLLEGHPRAQRIYRYFFLPCENKLSMKVFDSTTVLHEEQEHQLHLGYFIIHPCSRFKSNWDAIIVLVLAVNMIVLPIELAFFPKDQTTFWVAFNLSAALVFAVDMLVIFYSGVIATDTIHLNRAYLAARYIKTWFIFDLLGTVPFDNIIALVGLEGNVKLGKISTVLGTLKLLRILSLIRHVNQWQEIYVDSAHRVYVKLANIIVSILLLSHFNGCLLYFVPMCQDFPPGSWVHSSELLEKEWFDKYIWCLFSALSQMITVGFGKVNVERTEEVLLCGFVLISGTVGYGVLLANGTAIVQGFDSTKRANDQIASILMAEVNEYMDYRKLPQTLRARVTDYFENRYRGHYFDESKILSQLSEVLREDLLHHSCRSLLSKVPFFKNADPHFVCGVIKRLRSEFYQPGDVIITAGTVGTRMYFLQSGNVTVVLQNGTVVAHLKDGAYFGEMCLLLQKRRTASVVAMAYCSLYSLSHQDFTELLETYPKVKEKLVKEVFKRQAVNQAALLGRHLDPNSITVTIEDNDETRL